MDRADNENNNISLLRVVRYFPPEFGGGASTHVAELSKVIDPHLRMQVIVAPYQPGCEEHDRAFNVPIVRVKAPPICQVGFPVLAELLYSLYARKIIARIVEEYDINIVHIHTPLLAEYLIPQLRFHNSDLKIVIMNHGWPEKKSRRFGISYEILKRLIRLSYSSHYLILNDGSQFFELQDILNERRIPWTLVYHGIDTTVYSPKDVSSSKGFKILFPHRPIPIKSPDIAIKIFKKFSDRVKDPDTTLTILSANRTGIDGLKNIADDLGQTNNVKFMNSLIGESMIDCINQSSVVIGTSLNSNTGRATQEAMSCGKPVIVFNNGGISDLITHMENGMLVEPGDTEAFADALELLYHNPELRATLGRNARETIIQKRSWDSRIEKELYVYKQILGMSDSDYKEL